jgi:predicted transcriptional regulator
MKKVWMSMIMATVTTFALNVGEIPKSVTLSGENGGLVDGTDWNSLMIKDKLYVLFYVDPDKKDDNEKFIDALHQKNYNSKVYGSIAIINLKATWLPNFAIEKMLKSKQKEFPNTTYVKDKTKYLVKEWQLADDASNTIVFNKEGKVIYIHIGVIDENEMQNIFNIIEKNIK